MTTSTPTAISPAAVHEVPGRRIIAGRLPPPADGERSIRLRPLPLPSAAEASTALEIVDRSLKELW